MNHVYNMILYLCVNCLLDCEYQLVPKEDRGCLESMAAASHVFLPSVKKSYLNVTKRTKNGQFMGIYSYVLIVFEIFGLFWIWQNGDMNTTKVK